MFSPPPHPPHHVREFSILDSGFQAMDSGFQVLDFILFQCNLDSGFQSTGFRISQSKFSQIADSTIGSFSRKRIWRRQRERQKSNRFRLAEQLHCTCIPLFCTFLCRHCTDKTWKCLISRFVEDVKRRQRLYLFLNFNWYSLLEFNSRINCQHLMNWTRWNKHDKVWSSATDFSFTVIFS